MGGTAPGRLQQLLLATATATCMLLSWHTAQAVADSLSHQGSHGARPRARGDGGSARPPMGWNSWCTDGVCAARPQFCSDAEIRAVALAMEAQGLRDAGWNRIHLDDWRVHHPPTPSPPPRRRTIYI